LSRELGVSLAGLHGSGAGGRIIGRDVEVAAEQPRSDQEPPATGPSSLPRASFAARRAAASLGIDLAQVVPAASNNEITRQDVERAAAHVIQAHDRPSARSRVAPSPTRPDDGPAVVPLAGMRRVIATRMHASLQEMAQLTIGMEARADKLVALRTDLKRAWTLLDRPVPTFTDMIASAVAKVLPHHRRVNAVVTPNSIELLDAVHIGIAVALPDGLVVPVVRDADRLSLAELAEQSARLVALARAGALSIDDMNGATFSVTSLGGFGVDFFTPVINPPNVAILGVGRIRDGVRVTKKGRVRAARWLTLSLTFDHRAVDGAPAAEFLRDVCEVLEAPATLLS
jgi:pyruvate dehydrogenase E2 component (dihydrolipoamide acetyltransferase)